MKAMMKHTSVGLLAVLLAAVVVCGLGYAEGGRLSRRLGGWQVICWALVLSLPFMFVLMLWFWPQSFSSVNTAASRITRIAVTADGGWAGDAAT